MATRMVAHTGMCRYCAAREAANPPRIIRSPLARLAIRMTPNISDSPTAEMAKMPPSRIPWMTALTQLMPSLPRCCRTRCRSRRW